MTGTIAIISASAGSGKTTRLGKELCDAVASREVRPEAIIATTFTRKAAAELEARVRTTLIEAGRLEDAQRLAAARIGTVNAVCASFVADYAFELGLSPDLHALDEERSANALAQALSQTLSSPASSLQLDTLEELGQRMKEFEWRDVVRKIQALARANRLGSADLAACSARSVRELLGLIGTPSQTAATLDDAFRAAAERFADLVVDDENLTNTTREVLHNVRSALARIKNGGHPEWRIWGTLANCKVGVREREIFVPLQLAAAHHDRHPRLREDVELAITLSFDIARRSLDAYEAHKRAIGAIDFVDQEVLMLDLLERADVRARIAHDVDLLLVDEFQDTSPLQLAIFLKLAAIVPRSVWVGDQKQAIYGFRGADPSLMEAAIDGILGGSAPETLDRSWRSRPALVRVTSDLFAAAFEPHGVPAARVRLEPGNATEPEGLGPVLERWELDSKKAEGDARALANGVRELLDDETVHVRDVLSGAPRRLQRGDVAILCKRNDTCRAVAAELRRSGIRAVLALPLFGSTHEERLVLAGLRLWIDPDDALAKAELARIVHHADSGDAWLDLLLDREKPYARAFDLLPELARLRRLRKEMPNAGPVAAFDAVLEALDLRELCLGWGDSSQRLANLETLRARAFRYAEGCTEAGTAATPAGLVARFFDKEDPDAAPIPPDSPDAVVVSTWHRAKGLEWPVTVLFELETDPKAPAFDVCVEPPEGAFRLEDPLAGRWICFWPNPYHASSTKTPLHQRLLDHPLKTRRDTQRAREDMRLAYVGWTRARDRVVLAAKKGNVAKGVLGSLRDRAGEKLVGEPSADGTWVGLGVRVAGGGGVAGGVGAEALARSASTAPPELAPRTVGVGYEAAGVREHPPAFVSPSKHVEVVAGFDVRAGTPAPGALGVPTATAAHVTSVTAPGVTAAPIRIGARLALSGSPEMANLGSALHGFIAADDPAIPSAERRAAAEALLKRWDVPAALAAEDVVQMSDALRAWVAREWPAAKWRREWPLAMRLADGSVLGGYADLVLELPEGLVLVDHKSFPGRVEDALARAASHAPQLDAYARALEEATGKKVLARFIHLPVLGVVAPA